MLKYTELRAKIRLRTTICLVSKVRSAMASSYREFLPYVNFITANFINAVFQNYYLDLANAILWAIYFVTAYIK